MKGKGTNQQSKKKKKKKSWQGEREHRREVGQLVFFVSLSLLLPGDRLLLLPFKGLFNPTLSIFSKQKQKLFFFFFSVATSCIVFGEGEEEGIKKKMAEKQGSKNVSIFLCGLCL